MVAGRGIVAGRPRTSRAGGAAGTLQGRSANGTPGPPAQHRGLRRVAGWAIITTPSTRSRTSPAWPYWATRLSRALQLEHVCGLHELPRRGGLPYPEPPGRQTCLQSNSCPSHTGANPGVPDTQFSFVGRLWAEGIYAHALGNLVVPPNSPYPYCQFETGDADTDSGTIVGLTSFHPGGANVCLLDGSVRFLNSVAYSVIWCWTRNQGEVVTSDSY